MYAPQRHPRRKIEKDFFQGPEEEEEGAPPRRSARHPLPPIPRRPSSHFQEMRDEPVLPAAVTSPFSGIPQHEHRGYEDHASEPPLYQQHGYRDKPQHHDGDLPSLPSSPDTISNEPDHALTLKPVEPYRQKEGEEKIYVTVRLRPLSERETALRDLSAWRCADDHTLQYIDPVGERAPFPAQYQFDRVFGPQCKSDEVYREGARDVALSSIAGINASIFAYGMTSSGKTYTMRAITEAVVLDMFEQIRNTPQREFMIRVSALEIYNEVVRDLLNPDSGNLRLLDDPERGTVVERLTEEVVQSSFHLRQILSICETQRQVGETSLNDASSRSHQIVRLTVESGPRSSASLRTSLESFSGQILTASLNLVDLAGSERSSQTQSEGVRLKEGAHINRSLLTLGTVIRKLSGGNKTRAGHIPYRDSKLTRILQHSLGGNGRTAIICTLSPALSHVDQSRNTLSFATRAKEVTNSAHVNLMVSDKVLVKQLQGQVSRLEAQLRAAPSLDDLNAKARRILELEEEVAMAARQRNDAEVQLRELRKSFTSRPGPVHRPPALDLARKSFRRRSKKGLPGVEESEEGSGYSPATVVPTDGSYQGFLPGSWLIEQGAKERRRYRKAVTRNSLALVGEIRKLEHMQDELGEDASRAMEALQKEIECLRLAQLGINQEAADTIAKLQAEVTSIQELHNEKASPRPSTPSQEVPGVSPEVGVGNSGPNSDGTGSHHVSLREEISRLSREQGGDKTGSAIASLEQKLNSVQKSLDQMCAPPTGSPEDVETTQGSSTMESSGGNCRPEGFGEEDMGDGDEVTSRAATPVTSLQDPADESSTPSQIKPPPSLELRPARGGEMTATNEEQVEPIGRGRLGAAAAGSEASVKKPPSVDVRRMQSLFKVAAEENIKNIRSYVTELKERVAKLHFQKQLLVKQVLELEATGPKRGQSEEDEEQSEGGVRSSDQPSSPGSRDRFENDLALVVQLWHHCQVSLLHRTQFYLLINGDRGDLIYLNVERRRLEWLMEHCARCGVAYTNASGKILQRERRELAQRMKARLTQPEREELFSQWGISVKGKHRKLQLASLLWKDCEDERKVIASARIVGRILGFSEHRGTSKELFALCYDPPSGYKGWLPKLCN